MEEQREKIEEEIKERELIIREKLEQEI